MVKGFHKMFSVVGHGVYDIITQSLDGIAAHRVSSAQILRTSSNRYGRA